MNLPRHTLTSHAHSPTFVNAHFSTLTEQKGQEERASDAGAEAKVRLTTSHATQGTRGRDKDADKGDQAETSAPRTTSMFACATRQGFFVARTQPLSVVSRRDFSSVHGGLSHVSLIDNSSLLVLVGGGRVPRFAPNKVILWDEEATRLIPAKQVDDGTSSSEGTASPFASTLFSVGREEASRGDVDRDVENSQTLGDEASDEPVAMLDSVISADMPGLQTSSSTTGLQDTSPTSQMPSSSMASSAHLDDPFGPALASEKEPVVAQGSPSSASKQRAGSHIVAKGREVAEFEFGEAVKGICVRTFDVAGGSRATLLVVVLDRRAVVFEMGPHIAFDGAATRGAGEEAKTGWGIRQRLVVVIQPGLGKGMASLAPIQGSNCALLALPGRQAGHVQLVSIALSNTARTSIRSSIAGASTIIAAHANPISSITLADDGRLLCTTSERGTLLRVWSTLSPSSSSTTNLSTALVGELRRGSDSAKIWSVVFSPDGQLLAAGSDKGTIHFFNLHPIHQLVAPTPPHSPANAATTPTSAAVLPSSVSKRASKFLPPSLQQFAHSIPPSFVPQYLKSQWSFAQFKVSLTVFSSSISEESYTASPSLYRTKESDHRMQGGQEQETLGSGKQASLEGGWAGMRGRIEDVRRGEKGIEEGLWLTWIPATGEQPRQEPVTSKGRRQQLAGQSSQYELVAITSSGKYYRIAVADPSVGRANKAQEGSSTVLDMYKEDATAGGSSSVIPPQDEPGAPSDDGSMCSLLDYQRFGMRDDWID